MRAIPEDQLSHFLNFLDDGVIVFDSCQRIVFANDVAARMAGVESPAMMVTHSHADLLVLLDIRDEAGNVLLPAASPVQRALEGEQHSTTLIQWREAITGVAHRGSIRAWLRDDADEAVRDVIVVWQNRAATEDPVMRDGLYDALTGLPNRLLFRDRLAKLIATVRRYPTRRFAVLFCDLDRFKIVNDRLGHHSGDQMLIAIAARLEACVREGDTVARFGGDEFAILLVDLVNETDALEVATRIHESLTVPLVLETQAVFVSASIGIAFSGPEALSMDGFLRDADTAMYRAKAQGKAQHVVFVPTMHARAMTCQQLDNALRWAIAREEFVLYYQPIVALATSRITGFEVLVRWQHPELGLLFPQTFIPPAEETGMVAALDEWVLRTACQQFAQWQRHLPHELPLTLHVNVSGKTIARADFSDMVMRTIAATGVTRTSVQLEITESALITHTDSVATMLWQLRAAGIRMSLDDFGTGYASLTYLRQFPIETIKIDGAFLPDAVPVAQPDLTQAIVALAHHLGIEVIAEGAETAEQLAYVHALSCDYVQGHAVSRPLPAEDVPAWFLAASG